MKSETRRPNSNAPELRDSRAAAWTGATGNFILGNSRAPTYKSYCSLKDGGRYVGEVRRLRTFDDRFCVRYCKLALEFRTSGFGFRASGLPVGVHSSHRQVSGNPVRIGDGYATVTGYRLPGPLVRKQPGRRERGQMPEVRISAWLCSSWSRSAGSTSPSREG